MSATFPVCPIILGGILCLLVGLVLGVRALFVIGQSQGRLQGNGHAVMAVVISIAMLVGFPIVSLFVSVSEKRSSGVPASAVRQAARSLGRGSSATEHGPNCRSLQAAKNLSANMYKVEALRPIAQDEKLTTHEQMHLVDFVIDFVSADMYRKDVLVLLARNPALTIEGRDYLIENLKGMSTDMYKSDVLEALQEWNAPKSD